MRALLYPIMPDAYHEPVLLGEVRDALRPAHGKLMLDGTLGGGGHSEALLQAGAQVIALDQDPAALAYSADRLRTFGESFLPHRANFADAPSVLDQLGIATVDGALLDIGVSSHQLNDADRGFSFMHDGPLDMRMNPEAPVTAADLINTTEETELVRLFRTYGEEPSARRIARVLAARRAERPFERTLDLAETIEGAVPRRGRIHPATRVFQALRIAVNRELEVLEQALERLVPRLAPGGRFAVITFHSLEDRIVKHFFRHHATEWIDRPEWPEPRRNSDFDLHLITRRPITASDQEIKQNPRSRSARLRVAEKNPSHVR